MNTISPQNLFIVACSILIIFFSNKVYSQCSSSGGVPTIARDFGFGIDQYSRTQPEDMGFSTTYKQVYGENTTVGGDPDWVVDGEFAIINTTEDPWYMYSTVSTWHSDQKDHTGIPGGYMMIVNASAEPGEFYKETVSGLCTGVTYDFSAWVANIDSSSTTRRQPNVRFEIRSVVDGSLLSFYETGDLASHEQLTWEQHSLTFDATEDEVVLLLINNNPGGAGNDLLLDDISFKPCLPVYSITPSAEKFCVGESMLLSVVDDGVGYFTPEFQWQRKDVLGEWMDLGIETTQSYEIATLEMSDTGWYKVFIAERGVASSFQCRSEDSFYVAIDDVLDGGEIAPLQDICYETIPDTIRNVLLPSGGDSSYQYHWESSLDSVTWKIIASNTPNLSFLAPLKETTVFRRVVQSSCFTSYSDTSVISVFEALDAGEVTDDQIVCKDSLPDAIVEIREVSGGSSSYSYQWEKSLDSLSWDEINQADEKDYSSGLINQNQYFRRKVLDDQCGDAYSNHVLLKHQNTEAPAEQSVAVCQGDILETIEVNGESILWYDSLLDQTGGLNYSEISTNEAGDIELFVTNTIHDCESERSTISIRILPQPEVSAQSIAYCQGQEDTLRAEAINGTGEYVFTWISENETFIGNEQIIDYEENISYQLIVSDENDCQDTIEVEAQVYSLPELSGENISLCEGELGTILTTIQNATGEVFYTWEASTSIVLGNKSSIEVNPTESTSYSVSVVDENQCKDTLNIEAEVYSNPEVNVDSIAYCKGGEGVLNAEVENAWGELAYNWSPSSTLESPNGSSTKVASIESTVYTLVVLDEHFCSDTVEAIVHVLPKPEVSAQSIAYCQGQEDTLRAEAINGTGEYVFTWISENETFIGSEQIIDREENTSYQLIVSDENDCQDTVEVEAQVYLLPELSIEGEDVCSGKPAMLLAITDNAIQRFQWSSADEDDLGSTKSITVNPNKSTVYTLRLTDDNNCSDSSTFEVGITDVPQAIIEQQDTIICTEEVLVLSALNDVNQDYSFEWYTGDHVEDLGSMRVSSHSISTSDEGYYMVQVSNNGRCAVRSTPVFVKVENIDVSAYSDQQQVWEGETVNMWAISSVENSMFQWKTPEGELDDKAFQERASKSFTYEVEAEGQKCLALDSLFIEVFPEVIIPNGFSPNGDGKNDAWEVIGLETYSNAHVLVYNRWGALVFESTGYDSPWDGDNSWGNELPEATYYYVIETNDLKNNIYHGDVNIIR